MSDKITLRIQNNSTFIDGKLKSPIYKKLKKLLGYTPEDAKFIMYSNKKYKHWDGVVSTVCYSKKHCKCAIKKEGTHFPTGLLRKALKLFKEKGVDFVLKDERSKFDKSMDLRMSDEYEPRDYQEKAVKKMVEQERGILQAATGAGKSAMAADVISKIGQSPTVFYVPSLDLLKQSKDEFEKFIVDSSGNNIKVGAIGGGYCDIQDINVVTIQTAVRALGKKYKKADEDDKVEKDSKVVKDNYHNIKDLIGQSRAMLVDECQHVASESCQIIADASENARFRQGYSATPFRDKNDDILIEACFGKIAAKISASYLIKKGYLVRPNIYFVPVTNKRGTDTESYQEIYKEAITENVVRNEYIANIAKSLYEEGRNILILIRHIPHGEALQAMLPESVFIHGSTKKSDREEHLDKIRNHEERLTIASTIADEGINVRPWDTLLMAAGGKSQTRALQRVGRIIRTYEYPDGTYKNEATVIDFEDHCKYLLSHSRKRKKIYETEPEFNIEYLNI